MSAPTPNWIFLRENQHATFVIVYGVFDYYLCIGKGGSVTFKSLDPSKSIIIKKNIWGPGNIKLEANVTLSASIGVPPAKEQLTPNYHSNPQNVFTQFI